MGKAVHVTPGGIMKVVEIRSDGDDSILRQMQHYVGGDIEPVYLDTGVMYVNEEGLLRGYWPNKFAIHYANVHGLYSKENYLVGEVLIVGQEEGEDGCPSDAPQRLIEFVNKQLERNPEYRWPGISEVEI